MHKVIYCGLPGRLCQSEPCSVLDGAAAWAPPIPTWTDYGPFFAFMIYEGSYWRALLLWLFARPEED